MMREDEPGRETRVKVDASDAPTLPLSDSRFARVDREAEDALDADTMELIRLAVSIAVGDEAELRAAMLRAMEAGISPEWVEEVILQSYMFCGFPRCLNAAREWRRASGREAPLEDEGMDFGNVSEWRERGEATCAIVYGRFYDRLRHNVRRLHPALDEWMIVEGYGKLLARPALDLRRRELCIVGICAAGRQERQLHSHLHGALHAGATSHELRETLHLIDPLLTPELAGRYRRLLARVISD